MKGRVPSRRISGEGSVQQYTDAKPSKLLLALALIQRAAALPNPIKNGEQGL
jgi:hypothetical protein